MAEKVTVIIGGNAHELTAALNKAGADLNAFAKKQRSVSGDMASAWKFLGSSAFTGMAVAGVGLIGKSMLKTAAEFQTGMNKVQAVSLASAQDMGKLTKRARELGANTKYSATQAADAMYYLMQSGLDVNQTMEATQHVMNLAATSNLEMGQSADILTGIMAATKTPVEELAKTVDVLANAALMSKAEVADMGSAFASLGDIGANLGQSFNEQTAALAVLIDTGMDAGTAGTYMKNVFGDLIAPTDKAAAMMKKYGVNTKDADGKLLPLSNIVSQFAGKLETEADVQKYAGDVMEAFGERSGKALLTLATSDEKLQKFIQGLDKTGTASRMGEIQMRGLAGAIEELSGAWEDIAISGGDAGMLAGAESAIRGLTAALRGDSMEAVGSFGDALESLIFMGMDIGAGAIDWGGYVFGIDEATLKVQKFIDGMNMLSLIMPTAGLGLGGNVEPSGKYAAVEQKTQGAVSGVKESGKSQQYTMETGPMSTGVFSVETIQQENALIAEGLAQRLQILQESGYAEAETNAQKYELARQAGQDAIDLLNENNGDIGAAREAANQMAAEANVKADAEERRGLERLMKYGDESAQAYADRRLKILDEEASLASGMKTAQQSIESGFEDEGAAFEKFASDMVANTKGAAEAVVDMSSEIASSTPDVTGAFDEIADIPQTLDIGADIGSSMDDGIQTMVSSAQNGASETVGTMEPLPGEIGGIAGSAMAAGAAAINSQGAAMVAAAQRIAAQVTAAFQSGMYVPVVGNSIIPDMMEEIVGWFHWLDTETIKSATHTADATIEQMAKIAKAFNPDDYKSLLIPDVAVPVDPKEKKKTALELEIEAAEERNDEIKRINDDFNRELERFHSEKNSLAMEGMSELEKLAYEHAIKLDEFNMYPYSDEQREMLIEKMNETFEAQKALAIQQAEDEEMKEAIEKQQDMMKGFADAMGQGIAGTFQAVLQGEKDFAGKFLGSMRDFLVSMIQEYVAAQVAQVVATQTAEVAKAGMMSFTDFGASLAKVGPILAISAGAIGALNAIKFHEGGMVGNAWEPPRDVSVTLQTGERVVPRGGDGGAQTIIVPVSLDGREIARAVANVDPRRFQKGRI